MAVTPQPKRRTALAATVAGLTIAVAALTGPGAGPAHAGAPAAGATAGGASAIAQSYKINPSAAALSLGFTFGISLADYTNQVARSESRAIDLGVIGGTLAAPGCDGGAPTLAADQQPQPLRADSRDPKAAAGYTETEPRAPFITKSVRADSSPSSQADTVTGPLTAAGAPVAIQGAHSEAISRLVNGTREGVASVDIAGVSVAGVATLAGLHWNATYRSGAVDAVAGSFTLGSLTVLGTALPTTDALGALAQANTALLPLGVQFVPPSIHVENGIQFVDPLSVQIVPSPTRDAITGTLLQSSQFQSARKATFDALLAQSCKNASTITVADIVVGSITGAGSLSLDLGGVQARSAALKTSSFLNGVLDFAPPAGGSSLLPSLNAAPSSLSDSSSNFSSSGTTGLAGPTAVGSARTKRTVPAALAANIKGARGGRLALVGALGLLALLLVAERDRRLMRRAQRFAPPEG